MFPCFYRLYASPEEEGGDAYSPRKRFDTSKFFDNDKSGDKTNKELVDDSIDDLITGVGASESNKLKFKEFVLDILSLKPEVDQPNQKPLTIREQFFTAPKIEPSKLIPAESEETTKIESSKLIPTESERLNQKPLTIREQFFTAPKIEPSKLIPSEDKEVNKEFIEKLDELIQVIREDNKLEKESQKENKKQLEAKKGKTEKTE